MVFPLRCWFPLDIRHHFKIHSHASYLRHFVDGLLSLPPSVLQPQLSSPDVASTWQEISTIISSVEKQKSLLPEGQESPVLDVFQKLFLVMGFQVGRFALIATPRFYRLRLIIINSI